MKLKFQRLAALDPNDPLADLVIDAAVFDAFGPAAFGLRSLDAESRVRDVLVACFDLEGFTVFSEQANPQLFVPAFVTDFLNWLITALKTALLEDPPDRTLDGSGGTRSLKRLYGPLPFFGKYTGDGMLLLFDISAKTTRASCASASKLDSRSEIQGDLWNIISSIYSVCHYGYSRVFVPRIRKRYAKIPPRLRCGMAFGQVCSLGPGIDFVGPCINTASRLQKFNGLGFCVLKKGLLDTNNPSPPLADLFVTKKVEIRSIGEELVLVLKDELAKLEPNDQLLFKEP
jgi:class 3 adenylate cyclase